MKFHPFHVTFIEKQAKGILMKIKEKENLLEKDIGLVTLAAKDIQGTINLHVGDVFYHKKTDSVYICSFHKINLTNKSIKNFGFYNFEGHIEFLEYKAFKEIILDKNGGSFETELDFIGNIFVHEDFVYEAKSRLSFSIKNQDLISKIYNAKDIFFIQIILISLLDIMYF